MTNLLTTKVYQKCSFLFAISMKADEDAETRILSCQMFSKIDGLLTYKTQMSQMNTQSMVYETDYKSLNNEHLMMNGRKKCNNIIFQES